VALGSRIGSKAYKNTIFLLTNKHIFNRYPGCACDVPSVNYQFSWKVKLWTHYYSYAPEIWQYLKAIEEENKFISKYIKLRHQIERVEWDNNVGVWRMKIRNLETNEVIEDAAEFFINAGGVLNNWKWPNIPGLHSFKGKLMHSANYEEGYDLSGEKVAVIGAGSSGVQIVAAIQKRVEMLYHWIRSPIWITAGFAQTWAGKDGANFACMPNLLACDTLVLTMSTQIAKSNLNILRSIPKNTSNIENRSRMS